MARGDPYYKDAMYSGRCGTCGKRIPARARIVYAPNGGRIFCVKPNGQGCGDELMRSMATMSHSKPNEEGEK